MLRLSGFELYSLWVPLIQYRIAFHVSTNSYPVCGPGSNVELYMCRT